MKEDSRVTIRDFKGLFSNGFAGAIPENTAQVQVNCSTASMGVLSARAGLRRMTFTGGEAFESSQIIALYRHQTKTDRDVIVYQMANGKLCGADTLTTVADATANLGAPSLSTGWNVARRLCMAKTRFGDLIGVNGIDRGFRWDGITSATEELGMDAPTVAPTIAQASGGGQSAGTYTFAYRYVDNTLPVPVASSFSPLQTSVATATQKPNWTIPAPTQTRATHIELWRTVAADVASFFKVGTIAVGVTTFTTDTSTDDTLLDSDDDDTLFNPNADGSPDAMRFTPPPNFMGIACLFQDRMVYCLGVTYNAGTVATNGSTTLTFTGAAITAAMAGRYIEISGEPAPLLISTVNVGAQTCVASSAATTTASGKSYIIYPDPTYRRKLLYSEQDEPESVPLTNTITLQENTGDDDKIVGAHQYGTNLYVLTERHKYAVRWSEQPLIDGTAALVDDRGAFNHWCFAIYENTAYAMDDAGPYQFTIDGGSTPIGEAIQNLWTANSGDRIDFSKKDKFFIQCDRAEEKIHFFVMFTSDTGTYPQRRLTLNLRTGTFDPCKFVNEFGAACYFMNSSKPRVLLGAKNEGLYLMDEGTTEGVVAHVRGSPTSANSTVITDTTASFPAGVIGASVSIIDGTGKGQTRLITAYTGTTLTTSSWTTTPDTTSVYLVGAIDYQWRSKRFEFVENPDENFRRARVSYLPTTGNFWADLRLYFNNDSSPVTFDVSQNMGDGVVIEETNRQDVKLKFQTADSALENSVGFHQFDFSGRLCDQAHTDRWVAVELRGYQGDDAIEVYAVDVQGVR